MADVSLKRNKILVISAQPGAQTGRLIDPEYHGLDSELVFYANKIASTVYGEGVFASGNGIKTTSRQSSGKMISRALQNIALARAEEGMATIILDPNCISDIERSDYVDIANESGSDIEFLIMPSSPKEAQNYASETKTLISQVMDRYERFDRNTQYPHTIYDENTKFVIDNSYLDNDKLDVVGDVHGMYEDLLILLDKLGYKVENNIASHKEGRKLLFMGDLVDRGPDSLGVVKLAMNTVKAGNGYAIAGNHEQMLIDSMYTAEKHNRLKPSSLSSGETMGYILRSNKDEREEMMDFIKNLPDFYLYKDEKGNKYAFVHADVETFNPLLTPKTHLMDGDGRHVEKDSDKGYQILYNKGFNEYALIRGHKKSTSHQPDVVSLEDGQAFGGNLVALPLDKALTLKNIKGMSLKDASDATVQKQKTNYHYGRRQQAYNKLYGAMENLSTQGLVEKKFDIEKGLIHYVGTPEMYEKNFFLSIPGLKKATGLVLDTGGKIAIHSADRVGEAGDDIDYPKPEDEVAVIKFTRGFEVNVSTDPYGTGLLIATSSSLKSRYVEMAEESLKESGLYDKLNEYLSGKNCTFTLKIKHPEDKRSKVKEDSDEKYGATLISGRMNTPAGYVLNEKHLDKAGKELEIERPEWKKYSFEDVISNTVSTYTDNKESSDEFFKKDSYITLRPYKEDGDMEPSYFRMLSPQNFEKKLYNYMTRTNLEEAAKTRGKSLDGQHYVFRLAVAYVFKNNSYKDLIETCDLAGTKKNKEIPYKERNELLEKNKQKRQEMAVNAIKFAYVKALEDGMDPSKKQINLRNEAREKEKMEMQEQKKQAFLKRKQNKTPSI